MKISTLMLVIFSAFFTSAAYARGGSDTGNGGDVLVCFKSPKAKESVESILEKNRKNKSKEDPFEGVLDQITEVKFFDLFLLENKKGARPIASDLSTDEIINQRLALVHTKSNFYDSITDAKEEIERGGWYHSNSGVEEIDDAADRIGYSNRCLLAQLGFQDRISPTITKVYYDQRIFDKMKPLHQAAFFIHEWIYHIAVDAGKTDSRTVQDLVGIIFDQSFKGYPARDFNNRIQNLKFNSQNLEEPTVLQIYGKSLLAYYKNYEYRLVEPTALDVKSNTFVFYEVHQAHNGGINRGQTAASATPTIGNQKIPLAAGDISFYDTGDMHSGTLERPAQLQVGSESIPFATGTIRFFQSGAISNGTLDGSLQIQGFWIKDEVSWYENGSLKTFTLAQPVEVYGIPISAGTKLELDESGRVVLLSVFDDVTKIMLANGKTVECRAGDIRFDSSTKTLSSCLLKGGLELDRVRYQADKMSFYPDGKLRSGILDDSRLEVAKEILGYPCHNQVTYYPSGKFQGCDLNHNSHARLGAESLFKWFGDDCPKICADQKMSVYESGALKSACMVTGHWGYEYERQGISWVQTDMEFYEDGKVKEGTLKYETTIHGTTYSQGTHIRLDENGNVIPFGAKK